MRRGRWSEVFIGATVKASGCWFVRLLPGGGCAPLQQQTLLCRGKIRIVNAHSMVMVVPCLDFREVVWVQEYVPVDYVFFCLFVLLYFLSYHIYLQTRQDSTSVYHQDS